MKIKKIVKEARKRKSKWWFDVPGAKFIDNGDWSDPEVTYMGFVLNYWDVENGLLEDYREEFPEDKNDKGFDAWMAKQGGQNGLIHRHLENLAYAAIDGDVSEEEWLGIPDAYKVGYAAGQPDGDYILYKDWLVDVSDLEYYDKDYDDYFTYQEDPQGFEAYYIDKANRGELIDQLNSRVGGIMSESTMNDDWDGEGLEEKVLNMPDRIDELVSEIEYAWILLEDESADVDKIMQLVQNYIELYKIDPKEAQKMLGA